MGIRNCLLAKIDLKTEAVLNCIGHRILKAWSGCLVQCSEQFTALQKRRAAQNRDVHLTVISCQLGQQVGFKRGPQQSTGHTWKRLVN